MRIRATISVPNARRHRPWPPCLRCAAPAPALPMAPVPAKTPIRFSSPIRIKVKVVRASRRGVCRWTPGLPMRPENRFNFGHTSPAIASRCIQIGYFRCPMLCGLMSRGLVDSLKEVRAECRAGLRSDLSEHRSARKRRNWPRKKKNHSLKPMPATARPMAGICSPAPSSRSTA